MIKKLLVIIVVLLALIGIGGYLLFDFSGNKEVVETEKTVKRIDTGKVISPIAAYSQNSVWYATANRKLMWYDIQTSSVSEYPLQSMIGDTFKKIYWPISGNDFISLSDYQSSYVFNYYSYAEKKFYPLAKNVVDLDWMNDSKRIIYIWKSDDGTLSLNKSNADGTGYFQVAALPNWPDLMIKASPLNATALAVRARPDGAISKIYSFDLETGKYSEVVSEGKNNAVLWSPKGDKFAFTKLIDSESYLYVHDVIGKTNVEIAKAEIDEAAFSGDGKSIFVAVNDESTSIDEIRKFGFAGGLGESVMKLPANVFAKNLVVVGADIFFTDSVTGNLYQID